MTLQPELEFEGRLQHQAQALRRQGLSYEEIRERLGIRSNAQLAKWIKDIPGRTHHRYKGAAKSAVYERAVALRKEGRSYREILEEIPVSKSTLSLWLRDVLLTDEQYAELARRQAANGSVRAAQNRARKEAKRREALRVGAMEIGPLSDRELLVAGVAAYWAEGSKEKPWGQSTSVSLINSDPGLIELFCRFLDLLGVPDDQRQYRLSIHESADVTAATEFWAALVGVDPGRFERPTLKRHNPKTTRYNVGVEYRGCLVIRVRRSTDLNRRLEGMAQGLVAGSARRPRTVD